MKTDVIVVGGGLVGCLVALRLVEAGLRVTVLDRQTPGQEASAAAAGILAAQVESKAPGAFFELGLESRALHVSMADELGSGCRSNGTLEATTDADHGALVAAASWQRDHGLRVDALDAAALRSLAPGLHPRFNGGVYFPDDASVDPTVLMRGVLSRAADRGVLVRDLDVASVLSEGGRVAGVRAKGAAGGASLMHAPVVVVCTGAWSGLVEGVPEASAIVPARGQLVEFAIDPVPFGPVVYAGGGYLVPRAGGRVCAGSTLEMVGFARGTTEDGLARIRDRAAATVPALARAAVNRSWSSFRPRTPDGLPLVGELRVPGLFLAAGHHRSGILLAPVTAEIVRDLIVHRRRHPHLDALDPYRFEKSPPA